MFFYAKVEIIPNKLMNAILRIVGGTKWSMPIKIENSFRVL